MLLRSLPLFLPLHFNTVQEAKAIPYWSLQTCACDTHQAITAKVMPASICPYSSCKHPNLSLRGRYLLNAKPAPPYNEELNPASQLAPSNENTKVARQEARNTILPFLSRFFPFEWLHCLALDTKAEQRLILQWQQYIQRQKKESAIQRP